MSVGFCMHYDVRLHGKRESLKKAPGVIEAYLKARAEEGEWSERYLNEHEEIGKWISEAFQDALKEPGEVQTVSLVNSDDDDSHYIFENIVNELFKKLPELQVAVYAQYEDTEYGECDAENLLYSPSDSTFGLEPTELIDGFRDSLPDEDWIPFGWRHPELTPPEAVADGEITTMGSWGEKELAILERALSGGGLEREMPFFKKQPQKSGTELFSRTKNGFMMAVSGPIDFGDLFSHLPVVLEDYASRHRDSYEELCRAMREKKLLLHVSMTEQSCPDRFWNYSNQSRWHFLISSSGKELVSTFTWCGTDFFRDGPAEPFWKYREIYKAVTGEEMEEDEYSDFWSGAKGVGFMAAVQNFIAAGHPVPEMEASGEDDEGAGDFWGVGDNDEEDWDEEDWEDEFMEDENGQRTEEKARLRAFGETYRSELLPILKQAMAREEPSAARRYVPENFDKRFQGQRFVVKGKMDGWTEEMVKSIIEGFGGTIGKNVTANVHYMVYGSGVGDPFCTALKHGVTFLSQDYFEDMIQ